MTKTLLIESFYASWRLDFGGYRRVLTAGGIDRVSAWRGSSSARRDGVAAFARSLGDSAGHPGGLARPRVGHGRASHRALALTFPVGLGIPLLFTVCRERILQLTARYKSAFGVIRKTINEDLTFCWICSTF